MSIDERRHGSPVQPGDRIMSSYSTLAYDNISNVLWTHALSPGVYFHDHSGHPVRVAIATVEFLVGKWPDCKVSIFGTGFEDPLWGDIVTMDQKGAWIRIRGGLHGYLLSPVALDYLVKAWPEYAHICSDDGEYLRDRDL